MNAKNEATKIDLVTYEWKLFFDTAYFWLFYDLGGLEHLTLRSMRGIYKLEWMLCV